MDFATVSSLSYKWLRNNATVTKRKISIINQLNCYIINRRFETLTSYYLETIKTYGGKSLLKRFRLIEKDALMVAAFTASSAKGH